MSLKLTKHILRLVREANKLKRVDQNNKIDNSYLTIYVKPMVHILGTISILIILKNGISDSFINLISTTLSILIGLFITALVFSFDKFYEKLSKNELTSKDKLLDTQDYNYSKIFTYVTGYTIILSVVVILLIVPNTWGVYNMFYDLSTLQFDFSDVNSASVILFLKGLVLISQRFLIIYFLIEITYNTLYIVSSMINHMRAKIDR